MKITLNGDAYEAAGPLMISDLLAQLEIDARLIAVEHNAIVVKRAPSTRRPVAKAIN